MTHISINQLKVSNAGVLDNLNTIYSQQTCLEKNQQLTSAVNTTNDVAYTSNKNDNGLSIIHNLDSTNIHNITKLKLDNIQNAEQAKQYIKDGVTAKYKFKQEIQKLSQHYSELPDISINKILNTVKESNIYVASEELFPASKPQQHQKLRQSILQSKDLNLEIFEDKRQISAENLKQLLTNNSNLKILTCSPSSESFEDIKAYVNLNNHLEAINIYGGKFTTEQKEQINSLCKEKGFDVDTSSGTIIQLSKSIHGVKHTDTELLNHAMHEFNQYKFSLSKEQEEVFNTLNNNPNAEHNSKLPNSHTTHYGFQPENGINIENISFGIVNDITGNLDNKIITGKINTKAYIQSLSTLGVPQNIIEKSFNEAIQDSVKASISRQMPAGANVESTCLSAYINTKGIPANELYIKYKENIPKFISEGYKILEKLMFIDQSLPFMDDFLVNVLTNGAKKAFAESNINNGNLDENKFKSLLQENALNPETKKEAVNYIVERATEGKPQIAVDVAKHQLKLDGVL